MCDPASCQPAASAIFAGEAVQLHFPEPADDR
jgi:hypothetical protein